MALPTEAVGPAGLHTKYEVEVDGNALRLVPVEEEPLRTKEEVEQWVKSFLEWVDNLDPKAPHIPDEALRRESFYD